MVDLFSDKKIKLCCDWDRCTCDCSNLNEIRSLARKGEIGWDVFESHLNELRIYDGLLPSLIRAHNSDIFDIILMSELPDKILKKSAEYLKVPFNGIYGYYSFWKKKQHFPRPNPYIFENAIFPKFGYDKSLYVMFGNNHVDVECAKACGITSVGVTWDWKNGDNINENNCDFIIDKTEQFFEVMKYMYYNRYGKKVA